MKSEMYERFQNRIHHKENNTEIDGADGEYEEESIMPDSDTKEGIMVSNSNSLDGTYNEEDYEEEEEDSQVHALQPADFMPVIRYSGRMNKFWKPDIEQAFLERIKAFPCLYDHRDDNWKNKSHKETIWTLIGSEVGTAGTCVLFHLNK